jgi:predicted nucleic acid-binding protein
MPAMPTDALLDVNVLIAAVFADHPAHVKSRAMESSFTDSIQHPPLRADF